MDLSHEDAKQVKNGYEGKMKITKITTICSKRQAKQL
jgi:hypothetical protein